MSRCEEMQALISAMLDGELSEADAAAVQAHIAQCDDCRAMYAAFVAVSAAVSAEEEVPADLHGRIMSTVKAAEKATKTQKKLVQLRRTLSLAACLVVIVGTVFALRGALYRPKGNMMTGGSGNTAPAAMSGIHTESSTAGSGYATEDMASCEADPKIAYDAASSDGAIPAPVEEPETASQPINESNDLSAPTRIDGYYYAAPATMLVKVTQYIEGDEFVGVLVACSQDYFPAEAQLVLCGADGSVYESQPEPGGIAQLEFDHWEETDYGYTVYFSHVKIYEG